MKASAWVPAPLRPYARRLAKALIHQRRHLTLRLTTSWTGRLTGPIVVYQPGKVGSWAVYASLKDLGLPHPVYHAHFLTGFEELEAMMKVRLADPTESLEQLARDRQVQQALQERAAVAWNVVTLVRDPVARSISTFFQTLDGFYPQVQAQYRAGALPIDLLHRRFFEIGFNQVSPDHWFDEQLRPVTGIDVFTVPFPWEQGYEIIRQDRLTLLLIRTESLMNCAAGAFWNAFGIPGLRLSRHNTADQKWYRDLYRQFTDTLVLPQNFLEFMYDSRTARHFYSPTEIESLRVRWTRAR